MAELYTSLSRAKQILMATRDWRGEGAPPPPVAMTPIPEKVRHIVKPEYTIGLGALRECGTIEEDGKTFPCPECRSVEGCHGRGLQCPVCGEWFHVLRKHLNLAHGDRGGSPTIVAALSLPRTAGLSSRKYQAELKDRGAPVPVMRFNINRLNSRKSVRRTTRNNVGARNLTNTCEAQIKQRLMLLHDRAGRSPSVNEARMLDPGLAEAAVRLYGSWNNAKLQAGVPIREQGHRFDREKYNRAQVLSALSEWYQTHGDLPTSYQARRQDRVPLLPSHGAVRRAFGISSWREAMQEAAATLGIRGGRYGLPERQKAA